MSVKNSGSVPRAVRMRRRTERGAGVDPGVGHEDDAVGWGPQLRIRVSQPRRRTGPFRSSQYFLILSVYLSHPRNFFPHARAPRALAHTAQCLELLAKDEIGGRTRTR